jgi:hypothetical protein
LTKNREDDIVDALATNGSISLSAKPFCHGADPVRLVCARPHLRDRSDSGRGLIVSAGIARREFASTVELKRSVLVKRF